MKDIIIFSDGSSSGNPGPGGWGAIVYLPNGEVTELGGGEKHTTNNKMELSGAINALRFVKSAKEKIILNTDSHYLINGITKWVKAWQKNNWKNTQKEDVLNRELWEELISLTEDKDIVWNYVPGHSGVPDNEKCDFIATSFAFNKPPKLFSGKMSDYKINLSDLKVSNKKSAHSYISKVDGVIKIHKTWEECEKRVRGAKGAKFKKSKNEEDEKEIIKQMKLL
jgi:ribonuclease HI